MGAASVMLERYVKSRPFKNIVMKNQDHLKFMVFNKPFCITDFRLQERNLEYLRSFDPEYFIKTTNKCLKKQKEDYDIIDTITIRINYSHAVETLFSLLFATLQAPWCIIGWLHCYTVNDLKYLIKIIDKNETNFNYFKVRLDNHDWISVSKLINRFELPFEGIHEGFSKVWNILAKEFLNDPIQIEYNEIKHGFRARFGGFELNINHGKKIESGNNNKTTFFKGSNFGSSFW